MEVEEDREGWIETRVTELLKTLIHRTFHHHRGLGHHLVFYTLHVDIDYNNIQP